MVSTVKKKSNGYNYKYAELAQIHEELENQGITYYQYIDYDQNADADYVYTVIIKGDKESSPRRGCRVIIGHESKMSAAQAQGSALTYARRYSLLMALGWATEDDDGAGAGKQSTDQANSGGSRLNFNAVRNRLAGIDNLDELNNYWKELHLTDKQALALKSSFAKRKAEIGGDE
jgi:hypothetical protein